MIKKTLRIKTQKSGDSPAVWKDFEYENEDDGATVANALLSIPITWEHSCLQKKCGACAMVINSHPGLACDTRLMELEGEVVTIEPLRKFPIVKDLMVDRSGMMETLGKLSAWLEADAIPGKEEVSFEASKCLQCGICLELCPNFHDGGRFGGMAAMSALSRLIAESDKKNGKRLAKNYRNGVYEGCGKSLACRDVCPANIDIEKLLARSNAAAVWNRWGGGI